MKSVLKKIGEVIYEWVFIAVAMYALVASLLVFVCVIVFFLLLPLIVYLLVTGGF